MIPTIQIPNGRHDPVAVVEHRLTEIGVVADAVLQRLQAYRGMEDSTNWAHVGDVTHSLEMLEQIAAFLNIPGYPLR